MDEHTLHIGHPTDRIESDCSQKNKEINKTTRTIPSTFALHSFCRSFPVKYSMRCDDWCRKNGRITAIRLCLRPYRTYFADAATPDSVVARSFIQQSSKKLLESMQQGDNLPTSPLVSSGVEKPLHQQQFLDFIDSVKLKASSANVGNSSRFVVAFL